MDKLKMHTPSLADDNFAVLATMFPNAVTETIDENGAVVRAIDKNVLMQEINAHVVEGRPDEFLTMADKQQSLDGFTDNIKPDRSGEDLLFQVMLELGIPLSATISQDGILYNINDNYLIACFDMVDTDLITEIAKKKPYYAVFRDSSFYNDSAMVNFEQVFATYSPNTIRRVL